MAGPSTRADAGEQLAGAGGGVMNTVVGAHRNDTAGVSATEQVGVAKVVNVGHTSLEQVGSYRKIAAGDLFVIEVGAANLRFGMGLSSTRIGEPTRRDRLLLVSAFAMALLTLLGTVGEGLGMDRQLKSNTRKPAATRCFGRAACSTN